MARGLQRSVVGRVWVADKSPGQGERHGPRRTPVGAIPALLLAWGLLLATSPDLAAQTTWYRSIGTAADYGTLEPVLGNGTQVSVTNLSNVVDGVGGTTWSAANRGRGDRINIAGVDYTILSVASNTRLSLTAPYAGATATVNYAIARQFATVEAWVTCIESDRGVRGRLEQQPRRRRPGRGGHRLQGQRLRAAQRPADPQQRAGHHDRRHPRHHPDRRPRQPAPRGTRGAVVLDNPTCATPRNSIRSSSTTSPWSG